MQGVDTRTLTRRLREHGTMKGWMYPADMTLESAKENAASIDMRDEVFRATVQPKTLGTQALLDATVNQPLEWFIGYSSLVGRASGRPYSRFQHAIQKPRCNRLLRDPTAQIHRKGKLWKTVDWIIHQDRQVVTTLRQIPIARSFIATIE